MNIRSTLAGAAVTLALTAGAAAVPATADAQTSTAHRWLTTVRADGRHSLFGMIYQRHPRYSVRQVANEATATRNRFYPHMWIHGIIPAGRCVTIYV